MESVTFDMVQNKETAQFTVTCREIPYLTMTGPTRASTLKRVVDMYLDAITGAAPYPLKQLQELRAVIEAEPSLRVVWEEPYVFTTQTDVGFQWISNAMDRLLKIYPKTNGEGYFFQRQVLWPIDKSIEHGDFERPEEILEHWKWLYG